MKKQLTIASKLNINLKEDNVNVVSKELLLQV